MTPPQKTASTNEETRENGLKKNTENGLENFPEDRAENSIKNITLNISNENEVFLDKNGTSSASATCDTKGISRRKKTTLWLSFVSVSVVKFVEKLCGLWALLVARHPVVALVGSLLLVFILGTGLFRLKLVFRPYDLWVPQNSEFLQVTDWKTKNFPRVYREQVAIFEAENILQPNCIAEMYEFRKEVVLLKTEFFGKNITWKDVCFKIPLDSSEGFDSSDSSICYESSLFEIWGYDKDIEFFKNITQDEVIEAFKSANVSKISKLPTNFSHFLGDVTVDKNSHLIDANFALHTWLTKIDKQAIHEGNYEVDVGTGEKVDLEGLAFEKALVSLTKKWKGKNVRVTLRVGHSLGYTLHSAMAKDALWIGVGWTALLVYVFLTLGTPFSNTSGRRLFPASIGLLAVGLAVLSSYGLCSLFGIPYGTLNNVIPVLLVALGVDDMYVITTAWDSVKDKHNIEDKAQKAMQKAGMAITVTSLTNIVAFLVGTTTALPGLRWFCIYAASGITMIYFLQTTLFVAAMVINEKWIQSSKLKKGRSTYEINHKSIKNKHFSVSLKSIMNAWGKCLKLTSIKIIILCLTGTMFIFSLFNATFLSREFDTLWLVPKSSTVYQFYHTIEAKFPHIEERGLVFFKGAVFPDDLAALNKLSADLNSLPDVDRVSAWYDNIDFDEVFRQYPWLHTISKADQCDYLLEYIGIAKMKYFRIDLADASMDETELEEDEHSCSTFRIEFQYIPPNSFKEKQESMYRIRNLVKKSKVTGYKAPWAHVYGHWETDGIIMEDLFKSLSVVLAVIVLTSIVLLASIRTAFFVLLCVVGTLTNVASTLQLWGLTVNTVTGIAFVLAVGICVDYAAHIAHGFLHSPAITKLGRAQAALRNMGPAVFHGGASTCITFLLLAPSDSYIYVSYFKILSSVSFFGLFHALIFLPALLSLFGSGNKAPFATCTWKQLEQNLVSGKSTSEVIKCHRRCKSLPITVGVIGNEANPNKLVSSSHSMVIYNLV